MERRKVGWAWVLRERNTSTLAFKTKKSALGRKMTEKLIGWSIFTQRKGILSYQPHFLPVTGSVGQVRPGLGSETHSDIHATLQLSNCVPSTHTISRLRVLHLARWFCGSKEAITVYKTNKAMQEILSATVSEQVLRRCTEVFYSLTEAVQTIEMMFTNNFHSNKYSADLSQEHNQNM